MRFQSVRTRLTLWNVGVLALVLVLLGVLLRFTLQQTLLAGIDNRLRHMAEPVKRQFAISGFDQGPGGFGPPPRGDGPGAQPGPPPGNRSGPHNAGGPSGQPGAGWSDNVNGPSPNGNPGGGPDGGPDGPSGNFGGPRGMAFSVDANRPPRPRPQRIPLGDYPPRLLRSGGHQVGAPRGNQVEPYDRGLFDQSLSGGEKFGQTKAGDVMLRVYSAPLSENGHVAGVVQTAQPLTDVVRGVNQLTRTLLLVSPFALLIAGISGSMLALRALRPVKQLIRATAGIEATDLGGRIPVIGADEFAELSTTINGMFARLESSFAQQEEAIRQLRRFTADASHELRTPLTVIKANTSLALAGPDDLESYRLAMQEADWAADRMNAIVQDLLLLARSDGGSLDMTLDTVAVADLIEHAVRLVARADTAAIDVRPMAPNLVVLGDREAIARLIGNLLKNAQRHTPATGKIMIAAETEGAIIRITVADSGEGIAPQHLAHVFERFYRVDSARAREQGGTGLGLAICKTIAEAHGGTIEITTTVGIGTQVTVKLPSVASATDVPRY